MNENILAGIVTYGEIERFKHLKREIERLNSIDSISRIVIVDNGTKYDVQMMISELNIDVPVDIYHNSKNEGSAGGFGQIFKISKQKEDYTRLLILDDDSLVAKEALENVFKFEQENELEERYIWSLFRPVKYPDTFKKNWDWNERYLSNRIVGISIQQQLFGRLQKTYRKNKDIAVLLYAPYAGMLISKEIIDENFQPDDSYYLYVDDIDYSIQLKKYGISIFQIENAKIEDLEGSWGTKKHGMQSYFESEGNEFRYLYNVRNWIFMIKNQGYIHFNGIFKLNLILYHMMALAVMPKNKKGLLKYKKLCIAINDGISGNMGYKSDYFS